MTTITIKKIVVLSDGSTFTAKSSSFNLSKSKKKIISYDYIKEAQSRKTADKKTKFSASSRGYKNRYAVN